MTTGEAHTKVVLAIAERIFIEHGGKVRPKRSVELALQFVEEADNFTAWVQAQMNAQIPPEPVATLPTELPDVELEPVAI